MTAGRHGGRADAETLGIGAVAPLGQERQITEGRKRHAVLRLVRGETMEIAARELSVTAADLSSWRAAFLEAGAASLKARLRDDWDPTFNRLRTTAGELTMDNELLHAKVKGLKVGASFARRKSKR